MSDRPKHFESLYPENVRDSEIKQIVSYIKEGNSSQVIGLPGVGRATLLGFLSYNHGVHLRHFPTHHDIVHFVMVNFSEVRNRSLADVIKFLFLSLTTSLQERHKTEEYEKVDNIFKNSLQYNDELVFTQGLKTAVDYLCLERKMTIILLFDRFEEYIPSLTADFFTILRSLRDRAKYSFSAVFSLTRPLEELIEQNLMTDFSDFIAGHTVYLPLNDEASVAFRISYLEKLTHKTLSQQQKQEIISLTHGHMRLIKTFVEALLAQEHVEGELKTFFLNQKTVQGVLLSIWKGLTPSEQAVLRGKEKTEEAVIYLEKIGLLKEGRIQIPLFLEFIETENNLSQKEPLVYDEEKKTIRKGEVILSDSLTKAEFRLLRYLLQNPGRVVEREEIIAAVWQDDKSTSGVTDQAVDQLIFRLRRKIEADPNNPLHLRTVKSRGITFTP